MNSKAVQVKITLSGTVTCKELDTWGNNSKVNILLLSPQEFFMTHHLSCHIRFLPPVFVEKKKRHL